MQNSTLLRKGVVSHVRDFSSCMRYAYKRLLEGKTRKDLKKELQAMFKINSRYVDDAIMKAQSVISLCKEKKQSPVKVIFGGRKLFNKLKNKHLTGKRREKLKSEWREKRLLLYSRGDKTKAGNLNLRLIKENDSWYLRINVGNRKWIKAKVIRSVKREHDKWIGFMWKLTESELTGNYFPYYPAYSSIIGALKYCLNYLIDKDTAGAYVIGRRALGFKEDIPENYRKLLSDKDYMLYSITKLEERKQELKTKLKQETNIYKRKAIKQELSKLNKDIKLLRKHLQSLESEPETQQSVNRWKEHLRASAYAGVRLWQVLNMVSLIPPADLWANLNWRDTNRSARSVSFAHF